MSYLWDDFCDAFLPVAVTILFVAAFVYMFVMMGVSMNTGAICAAHGYPGDTTTWNFQRYCTRFEGATEHIIPLSEIK